MRLRGIYGIVDDGLVDDPVGFADALLSGGLRVLQYRAKRGVRHDVLRSLLERTRAAGALLIVNDDLEAALEADGWHAGQEDVAGRDLRAVRERLGTRVFGMSAGTSAQARLAEAAGADYVGVGPFAATLTKSDARSPIGAAGMRAVASATRLPIVAIGGIDARNVAEAAASGAAMAAVISALAKAPDPAHAARVLSSAWKRAAP